MSEIRDSVMAQMDIILYPYIPKDASPDKWLDDIERNILAIDELAIVDRGAELPYSVEDSFVSSEAMKTIKKAGWVKEVKD